MNDRNKNRPGYKESKVGWIPMEWTEEPLGNVCTLIKKKVGNKKITPMSLSSGKGFVPQYEKFGKDISGKQYVNYTHLKRGYFTYNKGNSNRYPQGCAYLLKSHDEVAVPNVFISFKLKETIANIGFFEQLFAANKHGRQLMKFINSGVRNDGLLNLTTEWFLKVRLPLPLLPEQEKIAEILGCWDEGLESLEKLIAAKKLRKKGLMQQLLTGEKRLPGFSKCWKEVSLGSISKAVKKAVGDKKVTPMSLSAGKGFVPQAEKFGRDISGKQYSKYTLLTKGCFTYNKGNSIRYPQGCAYLLEDRDEVAVPNVFISFKLDEKKADNKFFQQIFAANMHGKDLVKFINSGVRNDGLLNLTTAWFFKIKFTIPSVDEQKAIAAVLETADEEIR
ncbi:MAG TPA: restriction endonuclease subunit S, partial [Kiritimatiellia bacterium]|nr:restriction endonuclease subunit S [Kiritimatiellia bacterium]